MSYKLLKVVNSMANNTIGKNISELRKAKGITQEMLAEVVGVTSQAVSKWESGGTPDVELLPLLADYFSVSIDKLFNRAVNDYNDLEKGVVNYIAGFPQEERIKKAFELCWTVERSLMGYTDLEEHHSLNAILEKDDGYIYSQMILDSGITSMSMRKDLKYFLIMPEPECGWIKELGNEEKYLELFNLLGNTEILKALYLLFNRENKQFTPKLLEKGLKISKEKAIEILNLLSQYSFIHTSKIELDDEVQKIYNFFPNPAFIPLLAISNEMIKKPNCFYWTCHSRQKPFLGK